MLELDTHKKKKKKKEGVAAAAQGEGGVGSIHSKKVQETVGQPPQCEKGPKAVAAGSCTNNTPLLQSSFAGRQEAPGWRRFGVKHEFHPVLLTHFMCDSTFSWKTSKKMHTYECMHLKRCSEL